MRMPALELGEILTALPTLGGDELAYLADRMTDEKLARKRRLRERYSRAADTTDTVSVPPSNRNSASSSS